MDVIGINPYIPKELLPSKNMLDPIPPDIGHIFKFSHQGTVVHS